MHKHKFNNAIFENDDYEKYLIWGSDDWKKKHLYQNRKGKPYADFIRLMNEFSFEKQQMEELMREERQKVRKYMSLLWEYRQHVFEWLG